LFEDLKIIKIYMFRRKNETVKIETWELKVHKVLNEGGSIMFFHAKRNDHESDVSDIITLRDSKGFDVGTETGRSVNGRKEIIPDTLTEEQLNSLLERKIIADTKTSPYPGRFTLYRKA
jgi:hypothetical protein